MKAVTLLKTGSPEVLSFADVQAPVAGDQEVTIETRAIGLNFADIYRRRGEYPIQGPAPYILGHEGAGVILTVGTDVKEFKPGDRVVFAHVARANAEIVKAEAAKVVKLPDLVAFETAASIMLQGMTAHYLTHDSFTVLNGQTLLIHSASGGVGSLLVQMSKLRGAQVIATVSTREKRAHALAAGADHVVVRGETDWLSEVMKLTHNRGVDAVYDGIGATLAQSIEAVRPRGTAVYYGWAGGRPPLINPQSLMDDSKALVGGDLWSHIADRKSLVNRANTLFSWLNSKEIKLPPIETYDLHDAAIAHRHLESGRLVGKIVLVPSSAQRVGQN